MNALFDGSPLARTLGWMLVHFLWQGALIGGALAIVLVALSRAGARSRYAACCIGMVLMLVAPAITFLGVLDEPSGVRAVTESASPLQGATLRERLADVLPWLTLAWIVGVAAFQTRLLLQWVRAWQLPRRGSRPAPTFWQREFERLAARLDLSRVVRLVESVRVDVPTIVGWLAPVVLVPTGLWSTLPPDQLRAVLAHELAHVRRHDYLVNLLQSVFESLLFFHPATWWLSHRLRVEREYCCDDIAVRLSGDPLGYARALSTLDALASAEPHPALSSTGGSLMDRITRILGVGRPAPRHVGRWLAPALVAITMTTAMSATLAGEDCCATNDEACEHLVERCEEIHAACEEAGACTAELAAACSELQAECSELQEECSRLAVADCASATGIEVAVGIATDCDVEAAADCVLDPACNVPVDCEAETDELIVHEGGRRSAIAFGGAGTSETVAFTSPHDGDHDVSFGDGHAHGGAGASHATSHAAGHEEQGVMQLLADDHVEGLHAHLREIHDVMHDHLRALFGVEVGDASAPHESHEIKGTHAEHEVHGGHGSGQGAQAAHGAHGSAYASEQVHGDHGPESGKLHGAHGSAHGTLEIHGDHGPGHDEHEFHDVDAHPDHDGREIVIGEHASGADHDLQRLHDELVRLGSSVTPAVVEGLMGRLHRVLQHMELGDADTSHGRSAHAAPHASHERREY